jgi:ABC-type multidrug transport system ATPase subunit
MQIVLDNLGKKYAADWIFRDLSREIKRGQPLAVTGPNGSGKSTLIMLISGFTLPTKGTIKYQLDDKNIEATEIYKYVDLVAPYTELIEELTLYEFLKFHFSIKKLIPDIDINDLIESIQLWKHKDKYIRHFSSGMKQRLKLALGLYSTSPILLLDEPTTNLDVKNQEWYYTKINKLFGNKTLIIGSNKSEEYTFVSEIINFEEYK